MRYNEQGTLEETLKSISPLHLTGKLPKISYHIFHCDNDMSVNISAHSEKLVSEFKKKNFDYTFDIVSNRGHCDLTLEMKRKCADYILKHIV